MWHAGTGFSDLHHHTLFAWHPIPSAPVNIKWPGLLPTLLDHSLEGIDA
jgi:hypothetical protein